MTETPNYTFLTELPEILKRQVAYKEREKERNATRKHSGPSGRKKLASDHIIGIDGEGRTRESDNVHLYTLLASSTGECVEADDLSTYRCFQFLLRLPNPSLKVGFSFNYDVNMILRDVPEDTLQELWDEGECRWGPYKLSWIPDKKFTVSIGDRKAVIWDVFGFFQCSFVKALEMWKVCDDDTIAEILAMKNKRSTFSESERAEIKAYCFKECDLLVLLMSKLLAQTKELDITLHSYFGAGSIAAALMKKHRIRDFLTPPPESVFRASLQAYYGGRFEISRIGPLVQPIYGYDIRSAYPDQMRRLPCLKCGTWTEFEGTGKREKSAWQIINVRWNLPMGITWGPFPVRQRDGGIIYPFRGTGSYWKSEVDAADRLFPKKIKRSGGYSYQVSCDHQPFAFVPDLYELRNKLKQQDNFGQLVIKLGINSLYGKTAQSVGRGRFKPAYQSFLWAGMITSGTRAKLLDAISQEPTAVVSLATDGILSLTPLNLDCSEGLGNWDSAESDSLFIVQAGLYKFGTEGKFTEKTRGYSRKEVEFADIEAAFDLHGWKAQIPFDCVRFIGLGAALARKDFCGYWRKWVKLTKTVDFNPLPRRIPISALGAPNSPIPKIDPLIAPFENCEDQTNYPYKLKNEWEDLYESILLNLEMFDQPDFQDEQIAW